MDTVDSVIDSLGGTKIVSEALELSKPTVSLWRRRGIPASHWRSLTRLATERGVSGISMEILASIDEARA